MIDFKKNRSLGQWGDTENLRKKLDEITDFINAELAGLKRKRLCLGFHLIELYESKAYSIEARKYEPGLRLPVGVGNCSSDYFFAYCLDKFGLEKSQVSRYMNIADEFGSKLDDGRVSFVKPWDKYGYSQLVEMLPLTKEQRENVMSDWSVRRIRDYKASLVATSQHDADQYKDAVATSQQDKPLALPKQSRDSERYERFKGLTALQLCDQYLALEQEIDVLRCENVRLETLYNACLEYNPELKTIVAETLGVDG